MLILSFPVCCYLVWLTWVTVTSTPDTEAARDPTEEYFNERGIQVRHRGRIKVLCLGIAMHLILIQQVDLGPYHAGIDPYHDLDLPRPGPGAQPEPGQCGGGGGGRLLEMWVPYTAIIILFTVLIQVYSY